MPCLDQVTQLTSEQVWALNRLVPCGDEKETIQAIQNAEWLKKAEQAANEWFPEQTLTDAPTFSAADRQRAFMQSCRQIQDTEMPEWKLDSEAQSALRTLFRVDRFGNVVSLWAGQKSACGAAADHWWPRARLGRAVPENCVFLHAKANSRKSSRLPLFFDTSEWGEFLDIDQFHVYLFNYGVVGVLGVLPEWMDENAPERKAIHVLHEAIVSAHLAKAMSDGKERASCVIM
jgi:hypothetical protein